MPSVMPAYDVDLRTAHRGFDGETCWVQARAAALPGGAPQGGPRVVLTTQKLLLSGSDVFYDMHSTHSDDRGLTWSTLAPQPIRREVVDGEDRVVCDFWPAWHATSRTVLGIGHTACYVNNAIPHGPRHRMTAWSIYDAGSDLWSPPQMLAMPGGDAPGARFFCAGAGSAQRVDLPEGDILLPIYVLVAEKVYASLVARCSFDGQALAVQQLGSELSIPQPRGLYEPSVASCDGRFFITLRHDKAGYVARSDDGLHYDTPRPWTFDDGSDLGNYNTQQHWVTRGDALFLVYTRRGLNNDHVFRHRAPLMMAQVDPDRLCVLRDTERELIPQRGARLGNFGITVVDDDETWVTVTEWMQPRGCEKYGSDNTIWAARILWR